MPSLIMSKQFYKMTTGNIQQQLSIYTNLLYVPQASVLIFPPSLMLLAHWIRLFYSCLCSANSFFSKSILLQLLRLVLNHEEENKQRLGLISIHAPSSFSFISCYYIFILNVYILCVYTFIYYYKIQTIFNPHLKCCYRLCSFVFT